MSGPFVTAYVGADTIGDGQSVVELIDRARVEELGAEPLLATLVNPIDRHRVSGESEAAGIVVTPSQAATLDFVDPIRMPVVRVGHHPSLGPILEQHQLGIGAILGGRPELSMLRAEPQPPDSVHRAEPVTRMTRPPVSR